MTYFYALSDGSYSDYGVSGFYTADHEIPEESFQDFCNEQLEWEDQQLLAQGFTRNCRGHYTEQNTPHFIAYKNGRAWLESIGSKESRFVKLHNMTAVEYIELHRN